MSKQNKVMINGVEVLLQDENSDQEMVECIETEDSSYIIENEEFVTRQEFTVVDTNVLQISQDGSTLIEYLDPNYQDATEQSEHQEISNETEEGSEICSVKSVYSTIPGEEESHPLLYSEGQLYMQIEEGYYRCRLYPQCEALGHIEDNYFYLHNAHSHSESQENVKNNLLVNSEKNNENSDSNVHEEYQQIEYSNNQDDDNRKERLLTKKRRNHHQFDLKIIKEILNEDSDTQDDQEKEDQHPLNNFKLAPFLTIDNLGTRVLQCAGHLYIHSKNNSYVCYFSPKCFAMGRQYGKMFQLLKPHTKHGFKDHEWTKLRLISAIEKRVQGETHLLEQIFYEVCELPEFFHVKDSISVEHIKKLFIKPNEIKSAIFRPETKETKQYTIIESDEDGHVLYCDNQLYTSQNKMGYYRCRLYQQGCPATGRKTNAGFVLLQMHVGHSNQIAEKIKLEFIDILKKRAVEETSTYQTIYNEEASRPQFAELSLSVPYKTIYKVMRKARQTLKNHEETESNQTEQFIDTNSGEYEIVSEYNQSHDLEASETSANVQEFEESDGNTEMFTETDTGSMFIASDVTHSNRSEDNRSANSRSTVIACAEFTLMEGERLGSCILYCNEHLYTLNRNNYYRCRLYPQGCQATGMREGKYFRLCRGHNGHGSQEAERRRITLINTIKKRTMTYPDAEFFEAVFNEECEKPEYSDVVEKVSFTIVLNNMRKIWKRYQRNDPTLTRNIMKNEVVGQKLLEIKEEKKIVTSEPDDRDEHKMAVEVGNHIKCDTDLTPRDYIMMNGERLGSCILYCNHQLYTNNQRNYYRCRMYPAGCRATGMIKDKFFHLLKQHNGHGTQEREVKRLILITTIKRRAQVDPTRLLTIYKEECDRPEFREVAEMVSYKKIYSTLDRCRKRATVEYVDALEPVFPSDLNLDTSSSNQTLNQSEANGSEYNIENSWEHDQFEHVEDPSAENENKILIDGTTDSSSEVIKNTDQSLEDEEISQEFTLKTEIISEQPTEEMSQEELISQLGLDDSNPETEITADNSSSQNEQDSVRRDSEQNYLYIGGDRLGSKLLYCEGQLYCLNRDNYFRCRVYPNCIATGRIYGSTFRLHRGHTQHMLQDDEKDRLLLLTALKKRVSDENLPVRQIFDEECSRPEFREASTMVSYKQILSTLLKCRTRATAVIEKNAENPTEDVEESIEQIEAMLKDYSKCDEENDDHIDAQHELKKEMMSDADDSPVSDIEDTFLEVPKPDLYTPSKYTLLQGDRTGSRILYSNGHLYTRNRGTYYRCRMHPLCSGAGTVRGRLFQLTRQHADHPLQDDERTRLLLMNSLKRRALKENTSLKVIFEEEVARPEFASIADLVSFKMIQSTMVKCRDRVKYAGELGTILSSAEMSALRCEDEVEEEHTWDGEEDGIESDVEDSAKPPKAKRIKKEPIAEDEEEKHIYYYVLNIGDGENEDSRESEDILADYIQKDVIHTNTAQRDEISNVCSVKSNNIVVYTVDVNKQIISQQQPKFHSGVHFPDETISLEENTSDQSTMDSQKSIKYKMIEDCMNDTVVLYAGKQLYTHDKGNRYLCRVKTCKAVGEIKKNTFNLLQSHNQHPLQNKQRLQLKLISTIKKRSLERKTARVAKIFRDECARPEFRTVAGTITLDGVSDMIRRCKKKLYPRTPKILLDMLPEMISAELPPPTEFSVIHGTKPGIRLIFCDGGLFYHEGNGYYSCYLPECSANGRRDRMFFQLLKSHTDHAVLDVTDKDNLLPIIKELEAKLTSNKQKKTELYEDDVPSQTKSFGENGAERVFKKEIQSDDECNEALTDNSSVESGQLINEQNSSTNAAEHNLPNQKNILQQAWEDLQIRI